ncbi:MAG: septum formation protein Maf [Pedosphaera sp.]|nr:septum formation protein Maf [Pedosphaera sp.]
MRTLPPVLLASASPRRVELFRQVVPFFEVIPSHVPESNDASLGIQHLCEVNAERKAYSVALLYPGSLVVGADTLVWLEGEPLTKPVDDLEARSLLLRLSGQVHQVVTGVCLIHQASGWIQLFSETTQVRFRSYDHRVIDDYLSKVYTLDKAGGYAIQEHGDLLVESVEGSVSNVIGLPVERLKRVLEFWDQSCQEG